MVTNARFIDIQAYFTQQEMYTIQAPVGDLTLPTQAMVRT